MPKVGEAPSVEMEVTHEVGGASYNDACLFVALQNLGIPLDCPSHGPFSVSFVNTLLRPLGIQLSNMIRPQCLLDGKYIVHDGLKQHFWALCVCEGVFTQRDGSDTKALTFSMVRDLLNDSSFNFFQFKACNTQCYLTHDCSGGSGMVYKRPSSSLPERPTPFYACPLQQCPVPGCGGTLMPHREVDAVLYDLSGPVSVIHEQKQCANRHGRASCGYNYRWEQGNKVNVLSPEELADGVLFVNSKKAFSVKYIEYHIELLFRGHLSSAAASHAYSMVFGDQGLHLNERFDKLHYSALFYYLVMKEFQPLGLHLEIIVGDELQDAHLDLYQAFCSSSVFPPPNRKKVKTVVMDGCLKLKPLCAEPPQKRAGRPRHSEETVGYHSNGWFMCCDPVSGRILGLEVMHEPENNDHAINMLESTLWLYPSLTCCVYDRACSLKPSAEELTSLEQITHYVVDWFHAYGHNKKGACNPRVLARCVITFCLYFFFPNK